MSFHTSASASILNCSCFRIAIHALRDENVRSYGQSKIELGEPKRYRMIKRLEPIIELHILMMLLCSDADQGQADTEHQSSDVKQILFGWREL